MKRHRRRGSDADFRELTLRDAQASLHNELEKLLKTSPPGQEEVSRVTGLLITRLCLGTL